MECATQDGLRNVEVLVRQDVVAHAPEVVAFGHRQAVCNLLLGCRIHEANHIPVPRSGWHSHHHIHAGHHESPIRTGFAVVAIREPLALALRARVHRRESGRFGGHLSGSIATPTRLLAHIPVRHQLRLALAGLALSQVAQIHPLLAAHSRLHEVKWQIKLVVLQFVDL